MIRRPPRSTQSRSSAASDVYKRQVTDNTLVPQSAYELIEFSDKRIISVGEYKSGEWTQIVKYENGKIHGLSLIHISEPTRPY